MFHLILLYPAIQLEYKSTKTPQNVCFKGFRRFLINMEIFLKNFHGFQNFVHRLRKDYSMNYFNSKRFWNKNTNPRTVFGIMVSRSRDVSLHFIENLIISCFLYIFWNFVKINETQLFKRVLTCFSKVFKSYFSVVPDFGRF